LKRNLDIDVQWVYFPLHPDTPAEGRPLEDLFAGRGLDLEAMHTRMKRLMDAEGLPYNRRTHTYNSRLAQELAKWGDSQTGFQAIHDALYRAYFVDGRNLADTKVLVDIAKSVGLSPDEARDVLTQRTFENAVDADWQKALRYGITGVPTFVVGGQKVVGAQPYGVLAEQLRAAGAQPKGAQG
jgi:predicted DsbA family dithiol-disulfide isomerase